MDSLRLLDIKCRSRIGVTREERTRPQSIRVDLDLGLDLEAAGNSDAIDLTVDYVKVVDRVRAIAAEREYLLVEALARTLCRRLLEENPIDQVQVTVRKRPVELKEKLSEVAVTLTRPA
ncbi:MAG: dihydroneopterin aldolase [Candidatus Aminicenantes bacterium]|nr:dihydroneopterin aldolase [Candidatus Aminicenantes bacterium]